MEAFYREESIYNLLPLEHKKESRKAGKESRYKSIFRPSVLREIQERKTTQCKTMGIPKLQVPSPKNFLRKHSKGPKLPKRKRVPGSKKPLEPRVPRRNEMPVMGIQSKKNFIAINVAGAVMGVAKKPMRATVDMRKGDKFLIEDSGLVKKYIKKKDFGMTPTYILKKKEEAEKAEEKTDTPAKEILKEKGFLKERGLRRLSKEEREKVLEGLKKNWEAINKVYQSLSVVVDTIPRKLRKEKMEVEMKQLEHDINALEKYNIIYIAEQ